MTQENLFACFPKARVSRTRALQNIICQAVTPNCRQCQQCLCQRISFSAVLYCLHL